MEKQLHDYTLEQLTQQLTKSIIDEKYELAAALQLEIDMR